jgi:hypothetical protein
MADNEKSQDPESSMDNSDVMTNNSPEKEWASIRPEESRPRATLSTPVSRASSIYSMSRQRSHNYWSCDENINDVGEEDGERGEEEKDPFEVGWENGERDPMNPRSKSKITKWAIVLICSVSSLCVYGNLQEFK